VRWREALCNASFNIAALYGTDHQLKPLVTPEIGAHQTCPPVLHSINASLQLSYITLNISGYILCTLMSPASSVGAPETATVSSPAGWLAQPRRLQALYEMIQPFNFYDA
jgi:hypothetical protein